MSKNVKFYSSDHFDAPVLKGDTWGYAANMLRKVLCEGFNSRTDLTSITSSGNYFIFTFATPHNYVQYQTINIIGTGNSVLDSEYFITDVTSLTVTVKPCDITGDLGPYGAIGITGVTVMVAPCGMTEKWRDGNRSVFVVDEPEEKCYFYIDDEIPDGWVQYTRVLPLVFITDKMTDINTVIGKRILPYDTSNPTRYNNKSYTDVNGNNATGIWKMPAFGLNTNGSINTSASAAIPAKWYIIGNGRFFYYIFPSTNEYNTSNGTIFISFGKFKGYNDADTSALNYSLKISNNSYSYPQFTHPSAFNSAYMYNYNNFSATGANSQPTDTGTCGSGLLSNYNGNKPVAANFLPKNGQPYSTTQYYVSGANNLAYPNKYNYRLELSKIEINEYGVIRGLLPGMLFMNNSPGFISSKIIRLSNKYMFFISGTYNLGAASATHSNIISLDYSEWLNYD